ncbi:MAG: formate dehydrogenase accessory sulfurtransferase FdhD [Proteobacteria bacterium]|nr:formate dehydrogenase accessory sulfurtransferase FdhD [Pseudomonadota bacterium]
MPTPSITSPSPAVDRARLSQGPLLSDARVDLTRGVEVRNEYGECQQVHIPAERPLTLYLDKVEIVTLMTVGAAPELLALGYLRNQRLVRSLAEIASVQVDWDVEACSITSCGGIAGLERRSAAKRIVTTGCGQGTVYASLMDEVDTLALDPDTRLRQRELYSLLEVMRMRDTIYKTAGSVHGCALFAGGELLMFTEDVGRHNAVDAISGWMWLHGVAGAGKVFYTTGRLTSEMVIKCALMGVTILVSRSGVTQMGYDIAARLGLALFARCANRHFLQYTAPDRFIAEPIPRPQPLPT